LISKETLAKKEFGEVRLYCVCIYLIVKPVDGVTLNLNSLYRLLRI
jgi:hypothetical protein